MEGQDYITWEAFLVAFRKKYFPENVRERKEVEFMELVKGLMSVTQYETKFTELSRFAPHLVKIEARKAHKFEALSEDSNPVFARDYQHWRFGHTLSL